MKKNEAKLIIHIKDLDPKLRYGEMIAIKYNYYPQHVNTMIKSLEYHGLIKTAASGRKKLVLTIPDETIQQAYKILE